MSNSKIIHPKAATMAGATGFIAAHDLNRVIQRHVSKRFSHQPSVINSIWMGATSGMVGITAVYPVDVVKTRLQNGASTATNALTLMTTILRSEGAAALYKGLGPQLAGTIPDKAISLGTRNFLSKQFEDSTSTRATMLAAAGAGAVQSVVMSPVEIVKVRMQLNSSLTIGTIVRSLGPNGLYRGFSSCFLRDIAFSTAYFTLYALAKQKLNIQDGSSFGLSLLAGTAAGIPAAFITTPLDVLKTRMQAGNKPQQLVRVTQQLIQQEGISGLFRGWGPRVSRIAPQFGIVLVTFDYLSNRFG